MQTDNRALRDRFEKLQTEARRLRALLDDPKHFERLHVEVSEEARRHRDALDPAQRTLDRARFEAEEARVSSLRVKRIRAEKEVTLQVFTAARLSFGILAVVGAAITGVHFGRFQHLGVIGWAVAFLGGGAFLTLAYRLGAQLRPALRHASGRRDEEV